ncbi:MAG: ABC transporter permease subunit [Oscillospiraceae bacterium]|nr:ABC transporter permease subunit [Oscillospiraceae bacterium]
MKAQKPPIKPYVRVLLYLVSVMFWLGVWAFFSWRIGKEILLPSPLVVWEKLINLAQTPTFWRTIALTLGRIIAGCALGIALGITLGLLTGSLRYLDIFLRPIVSCVQSIPVASIIILALIWLSKESVPVFAAAIMTGPVLLGNARQAIAETPVELREMAAIFHISFLKKLRFLYIPQILPYVLSGCVAAIGLGWKAGVAAEVLSIPRQAIGTEIYNSKIYLDSAALFAWTAAVVALSICLEVLIKFSVRKLGGMFEINQKKGRGS